MTNIRKINVAVVGLGWVATERHIPIILRNPHLYFYGVVDKRPERLAKTKSRYPWIQTSHSDTADMPWKEEVQAVLIATDPLSHYTLAKKVLLEGKHVLMEKPLTMTIEESQELLEIARQKNVSFCVVHNFQFARSTLKLKEHLARQELGEIISIEAVQYSNPRRRLPAWYEKLPFGLFYDESPHLCYMLQSLAGRSLSYVSSQVLKRPDRNTPAFVSAQYTAGSLPVRVTMNFEAGLSEWHVIVMGTKQTAIIDIFRDILVTIPNDGSHRAREILTTSASAIRTHAMGFLQAGLLLVARKLFYGADVVWQKFVDEIENQRPASEISAERGAEIVRMQHEIMQKSAIHEISA